jgi:hypothetical protein
MNINSSDPDQEIIKLLQELNSKRTEYPANLLAARRAAFLEKVAKYAQPATDPGITMNDHEFIDLLEGLKSTYGEYPPELFTQRRALFVKQVSNVSRVSLWNMVRSKIQTLFARRTGFPRTLSIHLLRPSAIVLFMALAAYVGFVFYGNRHQSLSTSPLPDGLPMIDSALATPTVELKTMCKDGYMPPLCLAKEFDNSHDLTFQGNGLARPAVAKDTLPGYGDIHLASYVNDGLYGPGASWVSNSPNSWIKIDLGKTTAINTVTFGRDRLGELNDRNPGRFVIEMAVSDDVYAHGNSDNDEHEYVKVYDSQQSGFTGVIPKSQTVLTQFSLVEARFIKITFENAGTAIDEVEAFVSPPPLPGGGPSTAAANILILNTFTPTPVNSPIPSFTAIPTDTMLPPTETETPLPTDTPIPTETETPLPTDTPIPTDTLIPMQTETLVPIPTDTASPIETEAFAPHLDSIDQIMEANTR